MADLALKNRNRNPNAILLLRREPVKSNVILTQAVVLVLNYIAFCLTVNDLKPPTVQWVNSEDKSFFGAFLCIGLGEFIVVANHRLIKDLIFSSDTFDLLGKLQVHEAFLRTYGGVCGAFFLLCNMAIGNLLYYILFHSYAPLSSKAEYAHMMNRRKARMLTNEEIFQILAYYDRLMNARLYPLLLNV